jgi:AraC family transcriptional regulator
MNAKMRALSNTNLAAPRFENGWPLVIAGLAERHSGTNAGISAQWQRFMPHIGRVPGQVGRATYGVVFDSLKHKHSFGYLVGVEVVPNASLPENFGHLEIPAHRYAVFVHDSHVSAIPRTMGAIFGEWLPQSGHEHAADGADFFERYSEAFDPRTGTGGVEIWLPIEPAA